MFCQGKPTDTLFALLILCAFAREMEYRMCTDYTCILVLLWCQPSLWCRLRIVNHSHLRQLLHAEGRPTSAFRELMSEEEDKVTDLATRKLGCDLRPQGRHPGFTMDVYTPIKEANQIAGAI